MIKLVANPKGRSIQFNFEYELTQHLKINHGCLAFVEEDNHYCNEHIQWLWEQYSKEFN